MMFKFIDVIPFIFYAGQVSYGMNKSYQAHLNLFFMTTSPFAKDIDQQKQPELVKTMFDLARAG